MGRVVAAVRRRRRAPRRPAVDDPARRRGQRQVTDFDTGSLRGRERRLASLGRASVDVPGQGESRPLGHLRDGTDRRGAAAAEARSWVRDRRFLRGRQRLLLPRPDLVARRIARLMYYSPEPASTSAGKSGFRIHVADVDAAGSVTDDRTCEFDRKPTTRSSRRGSGPVTTSFSRRSPEAGAPSLTGSHRGVARAGSRSGPDRQRMDDVARLAGWQTIIATVPSSTGGPAEIMALDLGSAVSRPVTFSAGDIVWQRVAKPS